MNLVYLKDIKPGDCFTLRFNSAYVVNICLQKLRTGVKVLRVNEDSKFNFVDTMRYNSYTHTHFELLGIARSKGFHTK